MAFEKVNPKQSFPQLEEEILKFWQENNVFEKTIENRKNCGSYEFYDGPPFATGTPHYGHILAGTIKDVVPRYWTMKGKKVERIFGWDCHGLPIENIVEKKLGISGIDDIEQKIGVHNFNEECRNNVFLYIEEWKKIVNRMGRWVDMDNPYRTMDSEFMETIWRVFKQLYNKGLIYEGYRVVPYCPRCSTPLSNFEVNQGYANKQDKSITIKFKIKGIDNKYILAWTTTPWTLVANLGLAVGESIDYVEIFDKQEGEIYILAKDRLSSYYRDESSYEILKNYKGSELIGIEYEPIFDDFANREVLPKGVELGKNSYKVIIGHHVTTESGTGIVHIAPAYGEDDYEIGKKQDLGFVSHISDTGKTENLLDNNGLWVFEYNEYAIQILKQKRKIISVSTIDHSYPFCWRCDTPLIYRAISAWYVKVEQIRDKMVANNDKITWVPENIKQGRFGEWLKQARDWNISRNRYWGSAIPIWKNKDKTLEYCVGSIEELYELNKDFGQIEKRNDGYYYKNDGIKVDLHKHYVDKIFIKHPQTGDTLTRISEVLDCWFESGSMPYASKHYPFENKENFKFPADFIAEGIDQTRGWFYTLIILSTALMDDTCFLNVIVNGTVLASDGKKMSKRLKNYPDPSHIFDNYGADAMRFYLMNSTVVEAQDFRFSENGVEEIVKQLILPLWNTFYFFTTYANIDNFDISNGNHSKENLLDKWIVSELNKLIKDVDNGFQTYRLQKTARPILEFMDKLTNWYIRRSRRRFWKSENDKDKLQAYTTLYEILVKLSQVMAPFTPFISEYIYKKLTGNISVHLTDFPICEETLIDSELNTDMDKVQKLVSLGLNWRTSRKIRVRQPLQSATIGETLSEYYQEILKEELNVKEIKIIPSSEIAKKICKPNARMLGPKYGKDVQNIIKQAKDGNFAELEGGKIKVLDYILEPEEFEIAYDNSGLNLDVEVGYGMVIAMDGNITKELELEGCVRDLVRFVQETRKEINYNVDDRINLCVQCDNVSEIISNHKEYLEKETLSKLCDTLSKFDIEKQMEINGSIYKIQLLKD